MFKPFTTCVSLDNIRRGTVHALFFCLKNIRLIGSSNLKLGILCRLAQEHQGELNSYPHKARTHTPR